MNIRKLSNAGLIASIMFISTRYLFIGLPYGYVHLGDTVLFVSSLILGGPIGGIAVGVGAFFADFFSTGYQIYALPSFFIKFLQVIFVSKIYELLIASNVKINSMIIFLITCLMSSVIMVLGYFLFEWFIFGYAVAIIGIVPNILQSLTGAILSLFFYKNAIKIQIGNY